MGLWAEIERGVGDFAFSIGEARVGGNYEKSTQHDIGPEQSHEMEGHMEKAQSWMRQGPARV